jgi:hypothetical protein
VDVAEINERYIRSIRSGVGGGAGGDTITNSATGSISAWLRSYSYANCGADVWFAGDPPRSG